MSVLYKGNWDVKEQPDSGRIEFGGDGRILHREYAGKYTDMVTLIASMSLGMADSEYAAYTLERGTLSRGRAGKGTFRLVYRFNGGVEGGIGGEEENPETVEIDWTPTDAPLVFAAMFQDSSVDSIAVDLVEQWLRTTRPEQRAEIEDQLAGFPGADEYLAMRVQGIDTVTLYIPVVRLTAVEAEVNPDCTCGFQQDPQLPSGYTAAIPAGYTWVKTADRSVREGPNEAWLHVQEWSGFNAVSASLYPEAPAGGGE